MSTTKNALTIKGYHNSGGDLKTEVGEGFSILDSIKGSVRITKLIVERKPDKHSTRIGMFAYLHTKPEYRSLGFSEVILTRDTYSDNGKFISRKMYIFSNVAVESVFMRGDKEEITFICSGFNQVEISKLGVSFNATQ